MDRGMTHQGGCRSLRTGSCARASERWHRRLDLAVTGRTAAYDHRHARFQTGSPPGRPTHMPAEDLRERDQLAIDARRDAGRSDRKERPVVVDEIAGAEVLQNIAARNTGTVIAVHDDHGIAEPIGSIERGHEIIQLSCD